MTRRSDKCDCCVYEYIYIYIEKPVGGAAVRRNRQNKYRGILEPRYHRKSSEETKSHYKTTVFPRN